MSIAERFIILDTETTGLLEEYGRVAEIALLEVKNDNGVLSVVDKFVQLINPEVDFSPEASKVNGLNLDMLKSEPKFIDVFPEIDCWLNIKVPFVMYNGTFDRKMLASEYSRINIKIPYLDTVDVFFLAKKKISKNDPRLETIIDRRSGLERKSMSQGSVAKALGINITGAHRAYQDVLILLEMYQILQNMPDLSSNSEDSFMSAVPAGQSNIQDCQTNKKVNTTLSSKSHSSTELQHTEIQVANLVTTTYDLTKHKAEIKSSISGIDLRQIIIDAVKTVREALDTYNHMIVEGLNISVSSKESSESAANLSASLSRAKTSLVKKRQDSLTSLKRVTVAVEVLFRDALINRIDESINSIQSERSTYIRKKYEIEKAESDKKRSLLEAKAQEEGQKIFDKRKHVNIDLAILDSLAEYEKNLTLGKDGIKEPSKVTKTKLDSSTVKDEIVYEVEIIDSKLIPMHFWSPDLNKIQKYVNDLNGECLISGVAITPRVKTRITKSRT
jgi:DNA polymerase III epsilon subunit-like protein